MAGRAAAAGTRGGRPSRTASTTSPVTRAQLLCSSSIATVPSRVVSVAFKMSKRQVSRSLTKILSWIRKATRQLP